MNTCASEVIRVFVTKNMKMKSDFETPDGNVYFIVRPREDGVDVLMSLRNKKGKLWRQVYGTKCGKDGEYTIGARVVPENEFYEAFDLIKAF